MTNVIRCRPRASETDQATLRRTYLVRPAATYFAAKEVAVAISKLQPPVETANADFSMLGVNIRASHDQRVAMQAPRGAVTFKDAAEMKG